MMSADQKNLVYIVSSSDKIAFESKRIVVNFVPYGRCTNRCIFCTPNIPAIKQAVNADVLLSRSYPLDDMVQAVSDAHQQNPDCKEVVITGTIGEPLLFLTKLLDFIPRIKQATSLPVRLNTNGQASRIFYPQYTALQVSKRLETAGLDSVVVSLNAVTEVDYNFLCRPRFHNAFMSVLEFVRIVQSTRIETYVSFVDYSKTHPDYPPLNKQVIRGFGRFMGIQSNHIIFRPLLE